MSAESTDRPRGGPKLMDAAIAEARVRGSEYVGTGHLALALLVIDDASGRDALARVGVDASALRRVVSETMRLRPEVAFRGSGHPGASARPPLTPNAKSAFELALSAARSEGAERLVARHVLIGLVRVSRGVAALALESIGVDAHRLEGDQA